MKDGDDSGNPTDENTDAGLARLLHDHQVNPTRQRLAIARCMFKHRQHLSADSVLVQVNLGDTYVSKATVYNTLKLFVEQGMLREVVIDSQRTLFDSNISDHHHILNVDTGEIRDIDPIQLAVPKLRELAPEESITSVDLVLRVSSKT